MDEESTPSAYVRIGLFPLGHVGLLLLACTSTTSAFLLFGCWADCVSRLLVKKKCVRVVVWCRLLLHSLMILDGVRYNFILSVGLLFGASTKFAILLCFLCHASPLYLHRQLVSSALVLYGFPWLILHCRSMPIILVV
jgi:hypothetical protein